MTRGAGGTVRLRITKSDTWRKFYDESIFCHYCNIELNKNTPESGKCEHNHISFDHKLPSSQGGGITLDNILSTCYFCNNLRGSMSYEKFKLFADSFIKFHRHNLNLVTTRFNSYRNNGILPKAAIKENENAMSQ